MADRYIVQRQLSDGKPGYWGNQEWWADRDKAKVYRLKHAAAKVALEYGGEIIELTSKIGNTVVYVYDLLEILRTLRNRANAETDWDNAEYRTYKRGTRYAYAESAKMIADLMEAQGVDVDAELAFL